jgi:hypothetical protein
MPPTVLLDALTSTDHLLVCTACGTQFDETDPTVLTSCRICDDRTFPYLYQLLYLRLSTSTVFLKALPFPPPNPKRYFAYQPLINAV